ncbi:MAG: SurA N-terminal domain-containing protein, partial [Pseudomonadota bacterium]|nr:SurA N-terminal domain-containing protein [Pseudomonadota bacterium]
MSIKNFSKGSIAVYVTACLAVLFIFSLVFSPSLQNNIISKKKIGKVGYENIDQQDFYMAYEQIKNQLLATNPGLNSKEGQLFIVNQTWQYVHTRYSVQAMMNQFDFVMPQ